MPSNTSRTKLDVHASPAVYLGLDAKSRSYLLGSLYDLHLSVSVDVTFLENVFPFRRFPQTSPASLLWGADAATSEGDARLGMFENVDPSVPFKSLDHQTLKAIGVPDLKLQEPELKMPVRPDAHSAVRPDLPPPTAPLAFKTLASKLTPACGGHQASKSQVKMFWQSQKPRCNPATCASSGQKQCQL